MEEGELLPPRSVVPFRRMLICFVPAELLLLLEYADIAYHPPRPVGIVIRVGFVALSVIAPIYQLIGTY